MTNRSPRNILVVGGGVGGISIAHHLLRNVLKNLSAQLQTTYKVTLLSPSKEFYWKVGSPRGVACPSLVPTEDLFYPIADGFKEYNQDSFQLIQGSATRLYPTRKLMVATAPDGATIDISYDSVIIATGTVSKSPLFSCVGSETLTKQALRDLHASLAKARSVLVAGGGPVGVETAAELGAELDSSKEITLLSGGERVLSHLDPRSSAEAQRRLERLGVTVRHKTRTVSTSAVNEATRVLFDNGEEAVVDVYIDATGNRPCSAFLPSEWLDTAGFVKTEVSTLRVEAPTSGSVEVQPLSVYAFGSVTSFSNGSYFDVSGAVKPLAESLRLDQIARQESESESRSNQDDDLNAEKTMAAPSGTTSWCWSFLPFMGGTPKRKLEYSSRSLMQFVPVGRDGGVGVVLGWRVPSLLVYVGKAKTFMMENIKPLVEGADYK